MRRADRQLLVMAALAAAHHGLTTQADNILEALPWLIPDEGLRSVCQAMILIGLEQPSAALACLTRVETPEGVALRQLIMMRYPTVVAERSGTPLLSFPANMATRGTA